MMQTPTTPNRSSAENLPSSRKRGSKNLSARTLYIVIGLLSFVGIFVAAIAVSQRQQLLRGPVAPTAPESQPSAAEGDVANCDLVFTVE